MNIANRLTILRVILIPVFLVFLLPCDVPFISDMVVKHNGNLIEVFALVSLGIFILASVTDFFDGYIARKYNMVSNFGKFMDPLADKLLVCSALIGLMHLGKLNIWFVLVIIARDFIISGFRLVAADRGIVIAAGMSGKVKTALQMIMICCLIPMINSTAFTVFIYILEVVVLILTIYSLFECMIKNRDVLKEGPKTEKQGDV